jgi:DNA-binding IclR family transcriptional regulator
MVRALQRALWIMECFDYKNPVLTLQEISKRADLPKSTTFRLVATLVDAGYLLQRSDQRYTLSYKLLLLGNIVQQTLDIYEITQPIMKELAEITGETVTLSAPAGYERICINVVESRSSLKAIALLGDRLPLLYGATGKTFLAAMSDTDIDYVWREQQDPKRKVTKKSLLETISAIRKNGYTVTRNDRVQGVFAIAIPIQDAADKIRYVLAITGPGERVEGREKQIIDLLRKAGDRIATLLSFKPVT